MKKLFLKYYIVAVYFCSTLVLFAQPGETGDGTGGLEGEDVAPSPIDDYIWVLAIVGLIFVFYRLRAIKTTKITN